MSYIVLARKYRPQNFKDLIGQQHIADILTKAITTNKIAHAYLFCGPRGIGKTSAARIFAMCLNCEDGPKTDPDISSPACKEIIKGSSMDVLEIDGASNRGIDEIRTLRENVKFAPGFGRYKIYIVDEVHMLTTEAFNALLKTLEEPPDHVKFIFATTDPNKVPATILSRCQRFDFKRIPVKTIVELLKDISKKEKLKIEDEALYAIAKAGQGSMRDALSVLDQISALSDRKIQASDVYSMLGIVELELLFELTDAIAQKDSVTALQILQKVIDQGKDIKQLYKDLIDHFRNLMVLKVGGVSLKQLVDYPGNIKEQIANQSGNMTLKEIIQSIDTFIHAQESSRITESLRIPLEIAVAKLTYRSELDGIELHNKPVPQKKTAEKKSQAQSISPQQARVKVDAPTGDLDLDKIVRLWDTLTYSVSRKKMSVATYLQEGTPIAFENNALTVGFPAEASFQMETLNSSENKKLIEDAFHEKLEENICINFVISEKIEPKQEDGSIQSALDTFGGKVINRWHND